MCIQINNEQTKHSIVRHCLAIDWKKKKKKKHKANTVKHGPTVIYQDNV